jgi:hypothetical protein
MGWFLFGIRSNSPRDPRPSARMQKPRLQLEYLEERIVFDNHFLGPNGPLIDIQTNDISAIADTDVPSVHVDLSGTFTKLESNRINMTVSSAVDDEFERNKNVDVMNSLSGNAALVDSIYADLFRRAGNSTNSMDAGSRANPSSVAHMTPTEAAKDLLQSGDGVEGLVAQIIQGQNKPIRTIKEKRRLRQTPGSKGIPNEEGT